MSESPRASLVGVCLLSAVACTGTGVMAEDEAPLEPLPELAPIAAEAAEVPWRALPSASHADVEPSMQLTASDGTGLRLVRLRARAVVREPLAFTELHLVFDNPADRTIEGNFTIDMPKGAAISRFAMLIGDTWQEGEVVERQAARVTYESFLHRRQDPALLENQSGNRFSARVFPIPARGRKELVVSYSQALGDADTPYVLPLAGLPELDEIDVEIAIETPKDAGGDGQQPSSRKTMLVQERRYTPREDLVVATGRHHAPVAVRAGDRAVARVIASGSMDADPVDALTILFDTSASRATDYAGQVRRLGALVAELRQVADDAAFPLRVVAFDQDVSVVFDGTADGFGAAQLDALFTRGAFGASDLDGALRRIGALGRMSRVLVMTDGVATAGGTEIASLTDATRGLARFGAQRIDAILDGGLHDREKLAAITTAGLSRDGVVIDGSLDVSRIVGKLSRGTLPDLKVSVPDATFVWPEVHRGLQADDTMLVYAELPAASAMDVVVEGEDRITHRVVWTEGEAPLVERALAGAHIAAMTAARSALPVTDEGARAAAKRDIVTMSTTHRVLSDFTAMLVLETQADYDRFGIRRESLADVLTVGDRGVEVIQRRDLMLAAARAAADAIAPAPAPAVGEVVLTDRPRDVIPAMARSFDTVASPGILGTMATETGHFLASPGDAFAVEEASDDVWAAIPDAQIGESFGVGGLGLIGTGRGGGGTGEGTIGLGRGDTGSEARTDRRVLGSVRAGRPRITGTRSNDFVRRVVRAHLNEVRFCWDAALRRDPALTGRVAIQFTIAASGAVPVAVVEETTIADPMLGRCIAIAAKRWRYGAGDGPSVVSQIFTLGRDGGPLPPAPVAASPVAPAEPPPEEHALHEIMTLVHAGRSHEALERAQAWHDRAPGDVLALVGMGEALERLGAERTAARVYGSIIDLFPSRADLRRFAGYRLDRLGGAARPLAVDTYRAALAQRRDHPNSHRMYAWALVRDGRLAEGFDAMMEGLRHTYPSGRFAGVGRIMQEDAEMIGTALVAAHPEQRAHVVALLGELRLAPASTPSTRFVMSWETDANDVDFHVYDGRGDHAYFREPALDSGGELFADVTTGYGPECFAIPGYAGAFPYRLQAQYYSRGPMGYGMGTLQIVEHDGKGGFRFDDRPFVILEDRALLDLGTLEGPLSGRDNA